MADFVYERSGSVFTPTKWAGSPWSESLQHGGPVNGLFARAAEEAAAVHGLRVARLTVDLFKPVPLAPLELEWRFVREGKRLAFVQAELRLPEAEAPISQASALLLRPIEGWQPAWRHAPPPPIDLSSAEPVEFVPKSMRSAMPDGFHWSFDVRMGADEDGPCTWVTSPLDLVAGEEMTPLQRCAAVGDVTFGVTGRSLLRAGVINGDAWQVPMINTDTTLYWERPPVGEWFGFRHALLTDHEGLGLADVGLADAEGRLGRATQALLANAMS